MTDVSNVLRVRDIGRGAIESLLDRYELFLEVQPEGAEITGSFWGDNEAGIVGDKVFVREDTPVHSLLHEACHIVCMSEDRRKGLDKDAGGDDLEEAAVCYLQVLMADQLKDVGRGRLMQDMDAWGYSFRLGDTLSWFESDADDALQFLQNHGLVSNDHEPTFQLRTS